MCIFYSVVCLLMDVKSSRDCMVVQFITAYAISAYHHYRGDTICYSAIRQGILYVIQLSDRVYNVTFPA
jgi:hypothetical protein